MGINSLAGHFFFFEITDVVFTHVQSSLLPEFALLFLLVSTMRGWRPQRRPVRVLGRRHEACTGTGSGVSTSGRAHSPRVSCVDHGVQHVCKFSVATAWTRTRRATDRDLETRKWMLGYAHNRQPTVNLRRKSKSLDICTDAPPTMILHSKKIWIICNVCNFMRTLCFWN